MKKLLELVWFVMLALVLALGFAWWKDYRPVCVCKPCECKECCRGK